MAEHQELLHQEPRTAPEPETAEQRTRRLGKRGLAGGVVAGGATAAKFGGLKVVLWLLAWNGAVDLLHLGLWGAVVIVAAILAVQLARRLGREG